MKSEDDPITDDEWLLRRVYKDRFRTQKVPVISPGAFEPRFKSNCDDDIDTDGISLYREACQNSPEEILVELDEQKRTQNGIVRVSVGFVKALGFTVEKKREPPIKGHVVIPQLNAEAYKSDKAKFKPKLLELATEASKENNIVRCPESFPENP